MVGKKEERRTGSGVSVISDDPFNISSGSHFLSRLLFGWSDRGKPSVSLRQVSECDGITTQAHKYHAAAAGDACDCLQGSATLRRLGRQGGSLRFVRRPDRRRDVERLLHYQCNTATTAIALWIYTKDKYIDCEKTIEEHR